MLLSGDTVETILSRPLSTCGSWLLHAASNDDSTISEMPSSNRLSAMTSAAQPKEGDVFHVDHKIVLRLSALKEAVQRGVG